MAKKESGYRIFLLGAGFSKPAGLPLGEELFAKIRSKVESSYGLETVFLKDLERYQEYQKLITKHEGQGEDIDLEKFMSFLDVEHFLRLKGSKTWSDEGNETQLMVRRAIGEVINQSTPEVASIPEAYFKFVENLSHTDTLITFNYDTLLEQLLEYVGKPYRLFPHRFKKITNYGGTIDNDTEEIVILKLHGSIDWFHDRYYLDAKDYYKSANLNIDSRYAVFEQPDLFQTEAIVDGQRPENDELSHISRIRNVDAFYQNSASFFDTPLILSPSYVKFLYANPLIELWHGLGRAGGYNLGINVLGFSLPEHDEYIRIFLYQLISNYQSLSWDVDMLGVLKDYVRFVDLRVTEEEKLSFINNYSFVDSEKTEFFFQGFGDEAISFLFEEPRT